MQWISDDNKCLCGSREFYEAKVLADNLEVLGLNGIWYKAIAAEVFDGSNSDFPFMYMVTVDRNQPLSY